jgi:AmiR/NasT family two-component response regulator
VPGEQPNQAFSSRILIEQAKGMVAENRGLTIEEAFAALRNYSRNHKLRLVDVADSIVSGSLPSSALGPPGRENPV